MQTSCFQNYLADGIGRRQGGIELAKTPLSADGWKPAVWVTLWKYVPVQRVCIDMLTFTQPTVNIKRLLDYVQHQVKDDAWSDSYPHVVAFPSGRRYVTDGHHKITVEMCKGEHWIDARVLTLPDDL